MLLILTTNSSVNRLKWVDGSQWCTQKAEKWRASLFIFFNYFLNFYYAAHDSGEQSEPVKLGDSDQFYYHFEVIWNAYSIF